ncbi:MAG: sigma-70 family RNA polymerase sigma factor [Eubacteriales bacterium]|nr:sigma-70 family RNA polymerase sigma factor [Eubacteriales bacterium]
MRSSCVIISEWEQKGADHITPEQYLEYLLEEYQNLVYSICLKSVGNPFDAEDLTQEVFLSAYKNLSRFDGTYEKAWLSKIAVHKCLDFLKASGRKTLPVEDTCFAQLPDKNPSPEDAYLRSDSDQRIRSLCNQLRSPYREVAAAHFCDELSVAEIARKEGKNTKTIQTQLYRARAMLKQLLEKDRPPVRGKPIPISGSKKERSG